MLRLATHTHGVPVFSSPAFSTPVFFHGPRFQRPRIRPPLLQQLIDISSPPGSQQQTLSAGHRIPFYK